MRHVNLFFILIILCNFSDMVFAEKDSSFYFTVTADMRYNYHGFRRVCRDIKEKLGGPGAFHISPGDIQPVEANRTIINEEFGENTIWYPVVGNHELDDPSGKDIEWIRREFGNLPYIVNKGPANCETTTYSFDYQNAHFVVLNEYYDGVSDTGANGDIVPELLSWLKDDLGKNEKPIIFVFGHEPAFPKPDSYWDEGRHYGDSLDQCPENRDAFWALLEEKNIVAYICGHIHRYSRYQHEGGKVWQVVPVTLPPPETSSKYDAWLNVKVGNDDVTFEVYRDCDEDGEYTLYDNWSVSMISKIVSN